MWKGVLFLEVYLGLDMNRRLHLTVILLLVSALPVHARTVNDSLGRTVSIPDKVTRVICSGSGCLRLLTYLEAQDMVIAADDIEGRRSRFDARPYSIAYPQFKELPVFGQFRGHDNPELILSLDPQPEVIFKTYGVSMGYAPEKLQEKTGIPVIALNYGNLGEHRSQLFDSLKLIGEILGRESRAAEVVSFFNAAISDLKKRSSSPASDIRPSVYLGGVAFKGPHGFQSTEPAYPPFLFLNVKNLAGEGRENLKELSYSIVSKEKIIEWDPEYIFLDLATLQLGNRGGGLFELRSDSAYRTLTAVQEGKVFGVLPYNWYARNFGSILANGYYIGKLLYPERFNDIEPKEKADRIYTFLVGRPVFQGLNERYQKMAFAPVSVR